eukprot:6328373-Amphidinium_carterae.1
MIDLDVDYDTEDSHAIKPEEGTQLAKPEAVEDEAIPQTHEPARPPQLDDCAHEGAAPPLQQLDSVTTTPTAVQLAPQEDLVTKDEPAQPADKQPSPHGTRESDHYDPVTRARVLSGRLHLGMELDDSNTLPRGQITKEYTVTWGLTVGTTRQEAEKLWAGLKPFSSMSDLLWHGCWHLDFLPNAQAPVEEHNLACAVWKKGYEWDKVIAAIKHCRREFRSMMDMLHEPWIALRQLVAKNKCAQRKAWDALLKASFLPTREEYERTSAKRLQILKTSNSDDGDKDKSTSSPVPLLKQGPGIPDARNKPHASTARNKSQASADTKVTVDQTHDTDASGRQTRVSKRPRSPSSSSADYTTDNDSPQYKSWSPFTVKDGIERRARRARTGPLPPWELKAQKSAAEQDPDAAPWQRHRSYKPRPQSPVYAAPKQGKITVAPPPPLLHRKPMQVLDVQH